MLRVAIVDSGLADIFQTKQMVVRDYIKDGEGDAYGHGTMCFQLINQSTARNITYYIVKVLDQNGTASIPYICEALEDLMDDKIDIICMSFAVVRKISKVQFQYIDHICRRLAERGTILISAHENRNFTESYPASFHQVIGITGGLFYSEDEFWFNKRQMEAVVSCNPVLVDISGSRRSFFSGNSKACAWMTKMVMDRFIRDADHMQILADFSSKSSWTSQDIVLDIRKLLYKNNGYHYDQLAGDSVFKQLIKITENLPVCYREQNFYKNKIVLNHEFYHRTEECNGLLNGIEAAFNITIPNCKIQINDFTNIFNLFSAVKKWLEEEEMHDES